MPLLTVHMTGLDQLSLKVKYLTQAAQQGLKYGVGEAAQMFEDAAKANAPVLTGRLRDGIHTETVTDTPETQVLAVTPIVPAANKWGFDPPYARRIEYGFVGPDSLGRVYHQAAQPYMRPAFDSEKDGATAAIKDNVYAQIDEAMAATSAKRNR
jgi:HK97 gp10 family phage protein